MKEEPPIIPDLEDPLIKWGKVQLFIKKHPEAKLRSTKKENGNIAKYLHEKSGSKTEVVEKGKWKYCETSS